MPSTPISSPQNPRVKLAVALRQARARRESGRFVFEGERELRRALEAGLCFREVFYLPAACESSARRQLLAALGAAGGELLEVSPRVFEKLAFGDRQEGIVAVADVPERRLSELSLPDAPLVAVVEGVEKPGNLGAVLRSADGVGVTALIAADARCDLYNHHVARASLGTLFTLPVTQATGLEALDWLTARRLQIVAARVDAEQPYCAVDWRRPSAIVLGSEATGLSSLWQGADVLPVKLPMLGQADSLNVSAAAAVLFYEALRQRSA